MYKLIIADDEKIIQEGLAHFVDWEEMGFEVVRTLGDGEEVIEFLESEPVDVVLTDIKMPHATGIDIARYVKEGDIPCKVVFISSHKEFELAHQAIKYGVENYILKPTDYNEVEEVFRKIKKELDTKAADIEARQKMEKRWEEMYPALTEKFVSSLIMGDAWNHKEDIERRMKLLYPEVDVQHCACILATLEICDYEHFLQNKWNYTAEQFDDAILNYFSIYRETGFFHIIYKYKGKIRFFMIMKEFGRNAKENSSLCVSRVNRFAEQMRDIYNLQISLEIDRIFENIYQVMDMREEIIRMSIRRDGDELYLQEQKKLLISHVISGNMGNAQSVMQSILQGLSEDTMNYRIHVVIDVFSAICSLLQENQPDLFTKIQPYVDYKSIMNMSTGAELVFYCDNMFDKLKLWESDSEKFDKSAFVDRVKEYIAEHIYEDILLEDAANEMYLSITHLRRLFKTQMGETFLQYVTRKKMEKAVELLADPRLKVCQIGEKLGYKTPRYFSKLFYNFMGYYPNQYRKEVLKLGEVPDEEESV